MSADRVPLPADRPKEWRELGEQLGGIGAQVDPRKLLELVANQLEESLKVAENSGKPGRKTANAYDAQADAVRLMSRGKSA